MRERSAFERELENLALYDTTPVPAKRPSADSVDAEAAEPLFTGTMRGPVAPLPGVAALKKAVEFNKKMHPKVSGISLADLRARLEVYINRAALDALIRQANAGAATPLYGSDDAEILTLLADQFQRKTCRTPTVGDISKQCSTGGMVAEDTLDALGFVYHSGSNKDLSSADLTNSTAASTLKKVSSAEFKDVEPALTAKTWFSYMVRPPWLGMPIKHGIHLVLLKRLRRAQRFLMGLAAYENLSPAELGKVLGLEEELKGARPGAATKSMHTFGLGIDIEFTHNPWLSNPERNTSKIAGITQRAAQLIGGKPASQKGITPQLLHRIAVDNQDTTKIYKNVSDWSNWLGSYFALANDQTRIESLLPALNATNPDIGFIRSGESVKSAAKRWSGTIKTDFDNFATAVARGGKEKDAVKNGFMNLPRDLVLGLREYACLGWGAVDFGSSESGDVMHFDCRIDGIGRAIRVATGLPAPSEGHRCIPAQTRGAASREFEYEDQKPATKPELRLKFTSKNIPGYKDAEGNNRSTPCSVYVPSALRDQPKIDLLVFFHGDDTCGSGHDFNPDKVMKLFELDKQVDQTPRKVALAVPVVFWIRGDDTNVQGIWSANSLNAFVDEVMKQIAKQSTVSTDVDHLILAGHSHAYFVFNTLSSQFVRGVKDTTKGALAKLDRVWGLDSTYGLGSAEALKKWADKLGTAQFRLVLSKDKYDETKNDCKLKKGDPPIKYWDCQMKGVTKLPDNLRVYKRSDRHCDIPKNCIKDLLNP